MAESAGGSGWAEVFLDGRKSKAELEYAEYPETPTRASRAVVVESEEEIVNAAREMASTLRRTPPPHASMESRVKDAPGWQRELANCRDDPRTQLGILDQMHAQSTSLVPTDRLVFEAQCRRVLDQLIVQVCAQCVAKEKEFWALSKAQLKRVEVALSSHLDEEEELAYQYGVHMTRGNLLCLLPGRWLNDEVMNFYWKMLEDREIRGYVEDGMSLDAAKNNCKNHFFTTFFYFKLVHQPKKYTYSNVERWTKNVDIFSRHKLFVPVHLGNHWVMTVVNLREKKFEFYDSLSGRQGNTIMEHLRRYLEDEHMAKKKTPFKCRDWPAVSSQSCPQQSNGFDCGMFTCKCANFLSQNLPLSYGQRNMPYFRQRMCLEILNMVVL